MVVSVRVVHPHDGVADWKLPFTAKAQHHERGLCPIGQAQGKDQNSRYIATEWVSLSHHCETKKS